MKGHTWKKYIRKFLQTISDSAHKLHIFHLLTVSFFSLKKPEKIGPLIFFASLISVHFQGKPFNNTVIQVYAPTNNAEEAEVELFYEDLQDLLELTPKKDVLFFIGDWNAKVEVKKHLK